MTHNLYMQCNVKSLICMTTFKNINYIILITIFVDILFTGISFYNLILEYIHLVLQSVSHFT